MRRSTSVLGPIVLAALLAATGCATTRHAPATYEQLGAAAGVERIVDDLLEKILADDASISSSPRPTSSASAKN